MPKVRQPIQTKPPIMEVLGHFYREIKVSANPPTFDEKGEDITPPEFYELDYVTDVSVSEEPQAPGGYYLMLKVETDADEATKAWDISVTAVGHIRFAEECPEDKREHLCFVMGQGILYGFIRELIHGLTHRGPHTPVYLPTVTFVPEEEQPVPDDAPDESSTENAAHSEG